eukprot:scaffold11576_cov17-Tisochrysis_lutea.AAC.1
MSNRCYFVISPRNFGLKGAFCGNCLQRSNEEAEQVWLGLLYKVFEKGQEVTDQERCVVGCFPTGRRRPQHLYQCNRGVYVSPHVLADALFCLASLQFQPRRMWLAAALSQVRRG